jgi:ABC-type Fe3+-siderophore transport system permease subunit
MAPFVVGILVPIGFFVMLFGILYVYFTTRNRERLAMIDKGADASLFQNPDRVSNIFKWGMFMVGIAIGIIFGAVLASSNIMDEGVSYPSMIFLFGGLSLIVVHLIEKKRQKTE